MRKYIVLLICVSAALAFSCSAEKIAEDIEKEQEEKLKELTEEEEEKETDQSAMLQGTWDATELKIDQNTASDQVKFAKQILDHLTNKECFIISFTFNTDLTVLAENAVNHLEINIGGTGLDIPCPEEKDTETSTYTYDGETLILKDGDGTNLEIAVTVEDDTMTVDAEDLNLPNFNEEGQLLFKKRE